jgi:hypothetical protein
MKEEHAKNKQAFESFNNSTFTEEQLVKLGVKISKSHK